MFHHILKHLEVCQVYLATRHVFQISSRCLEMQFRRNYRVMCVDVPFLPGKFEWCEPEKRLPFIETGNSWKMCSIIAQNAIDDTEYS